MQKDLCTVQEIITTLIGNERFCPMHLRAEIGMEHLSQFCNISNFESERRNLGSPFFEFDSAPHVLKIRPSESMALPW